MAFIRWLKRLGAAPASTSRSPDDDMTLPMPHRARDAQQHGHEEALNFYLAIQSHQKWKARLTQYVQGVRDGDHARMDIDTVCRDDRCALGLWLYHEACVPYALFGLFSRLMDEHAEFHLQAADVLRQAQAGDADGAMASLTRGACARASRQLIATLTELHLAVSTTLGWQQSHLLSRRLHNAGAF